MGELRLSDSWRLFTAGLALALLGLLSAASASADEVAVYTSPAHGPILVGPGGMTLYTFDRDSPGVSNCTDSCATVWPPFIPSGPVTGPGGLTLGTITRPDGAIQATFEDRPLYFFSRDTAPGETNGHGVGNAWWVVPAPAVETAAAEQVGVRETTDYGPILVGPNGMTLYTWDRDDPAAPTITTTASANWPLFLVSAPPVGPAGLPGVLSAKPRADGTLQATYNGWPLYYYARDNAPGDTNGQGSGNIWWVVRIGEATAPAPAAAPPPAPGGGLAVTQHPALGRILTTSAGMTLYYFGSDQPGVSTCYSDTGCSDYWPPLLAESEPVPPAGLTGQVGLIQRADGSWQVTHNGRPLYTYTGDRAPGDANGHLLVDEWGFWGAIQLQ